MESNKDCYNNVRYNSNINSVFNDINSSINHFLSISSVADANKSYGQLKRYLDNILVDLQKKEQQIADALEICEKYNANIIEDSKGSAEQDIFIKKSKNGNLFYNNLNSLPPQHNIKEMIPEIGYSVNIAHVDKLSDIPSMFYWYSDGIYCCPFPGIYVKVPFLEVVNTLKDTPKDRTVKCSYKTKEICSRYSRDRVCTFAHCGDTYVKISPYARCPKNPTFGDKISIVHDLSFLKEEDIRVVTMYGLSDIILMYLWYDMQKWSGSKIINDINKCI